MVTTRAAGMAFATARAFQGGRMMSFDPLMESSGPPHASRERRSTARTARARAARADGGTRDQHSALSQTTSFEVRLRTADAPDRDERQAERPEPPAPLATPARDAGGVGPGARRGEGGDPLLQ